VANIVVYEDNCKLELENMIQVIVVRGVCSAVWFDFEGKSHLYRKLKKHAVWFGSVDFKNKIRTKPNQCGLGWIGWCGFF